jgi:hypothetical protein
VREWDHGAGYKPCDRGTHTSPWAYHNAADAPDVATHLKRTGDCVPNGPGIPRPKAVPPGATPLTSPIGAGGRGDWPAQQGSGSHHHRRLTEGNTKAWPHNDLHARLVTAYFTVMTCAPQALTRR